jgi:hypothetical protein
METGAVSDNLLEASERHQVVIDDIWEKAATQAQTRRAQANMSIWEGQVGKEAAKTAMWATGIGAVGQAASTVAGGMGGTGGAPAGGQEFGNANAATNTRNYNASL